MKQEFIQIYVPDHCSNRMKVPRDFVKHLDAAVPEMLELHGLAKRPRYVKPRKIGDDLFFEAGWKEFVQDNGLVYADFLVFKYLGGSSFRVTIFGRNGVEKEHGSVNKCETPRSRVEEEEEEEQQEDSFEEEESDAASTALEEAERYISASKYPCFFKVMRASYLKNGSLAIPSEFLRDHIKKKEVKVLLRVGRKNWPVQVFSYKKSADKFYGGWKTFVIANKLQEDDVCVFELTRKTRLSELTRKMSVLRVSIFRQ